MDADEDRHRQLGPAEIDVMDTFGSSMRLLARALAVIAGALVGLLALAWASATVWIGLAEPVFLVILGGYALALGLVAYELLRRWPAARIWSLLAVVLPPAPFALSVLLGLLLPVQPTQPGSQPDMTSLLILPAAVTAIAALALVMNWRIART